MQSTTIWIQTLYAHVISRDVNVRGWGGVVSCLLNLRPGVPPPSSILPKPFCWNFSCGFVQNQPNSTSLKLANNSLFQIRIHLFVRALNQYTWVWYRNRFQCQNSGVSIRGVRRSLGIGSSAGDGAASNNTARSLVLYRGWQYAHVHSIRSVGAEIASKDSVACGLIVARTFSLHNDCNLNYSNGDPGRVKPQGWPAVPLGAARRGAAAAAAALLRSVHRSDTYLSLNS